MVEFKLVISDKTGKSYQREVKDKEAGALVGLRLGMTIPGDDLGFAGYEFVISGGSDNCGFPMRVGITGKRKRIFVLKGVGCKGKHKGKGVRSRKTVCGDTIHETISQINLKVIQEGKKPLAPKEEAPAAKKEEPKKAEAPKEKPAAKKEEPKKAEAPKEKPAAKKEEVKKETQPKEEKKEAPKEKAKK